jgi:uncharacterized protein YgiM (DUF1202 family)
MPFTVVRAGFRLCFVCALLGLLGLGPAPALVVAQEAVWPGAPAVITGGPDLVLLRSDPGYDAGVITPLANGTPVTVLDGPHYGADGSSWYQVDLGWQAGYAPAGSLGAAESAAVADPAPAAETAPVEAPVTEPVAAYEGAPAIGPGITTSDVNLRAEPNGDATVLSTLPPGSAVEVTGAAVAGYFPVLVNGAAAWIAAEYLQAGAPVPDPTLTEVAAPVPDPATTTAPAPDPAAAPVETGSLVAVTDANLRAEPYPEAAIIGSVPAGAGVTASGVAENGFTPVTVNGQFGWVGSDLVTSGDGAALAPGPGVTTATVPSAGGLISWPFRGGTWEVIQGYNNGTHQNRSSFANYHYSLDWARVGGGTAGTPVYAPASGTISWIDRGSGGMLIDMGNGYGVAMFHVTYDYSLSRGQSIQAGQPVGTISGPGGEGYMSTAHVDMTLWQLAGGGTHVATPFTGQFAIGGTEFPDTGGGNQHMGVEVTPPQ